MRKLWCGIVERSWHDDADVWEHDIDMNIYHVRFMKCLESAIETHEHDS
jgi:hypothetical protein